MLCVEFVNALTLLYVLWDTQRRLNRNGDAIATNEWNNRNVGEGIGRVVFGRNKESSRNLELLDLSSQQLGISTTMAVCVAPNHRYMTPETARGRFLQIDSSCALYEQYERCASAFCSLAMSKWLQRLLVSVRGARSQSSWIRRAKRRSQLGSPFSAVNLPSFRAMSMSYRVSSIKFGIIARPTTQRRQSYRYSNGCMKQVVVVVVVVEHSKDQESLLINAWRRSRSESSRIMVDAFEKVDKHNTRMVLPTTKNGICQEPSRVASSCHCQSCIFVMLLYYFVGVGCSPLFVRIMTIYIPRTYLHNAQWVSQVNNQPEMNVLVSLTQRERRVFASRHERWTHIGDITFERSTTAGRKACR